MFQLIRNPRKFLEVVREKSFEKINCKVEPKSPSQQRLEIGTLKGRTAQDQSQT